MFVRFWVQYRVNSFFVSYSKRTFDKHVGPVLEKHHAIQTDIFTPEAQVVYRINVTTEQHAGQVKDDLRKAMARISVRARPIELSVKV